MTKLDSPYNTSDVEVLARENCHDGYLKIDRITLRHMLFEGGWSDTMVRELQIKSRAIGVLLFDPVRDSVVLVRQFRVGLLDEDRAPWMLELVAGMLDEGEEPIDTAVRESREEADLEPLKVRQIADYYNSPGTTNERVTLFYGEVDSRQAHGIHGLDGENEDIQVIVLAFAEALEALKAGKLNNAMTLIAMQWLQLHRQELLNGVNSAYSA